MATTVAARIEPPSPGLIAPWWHTALLVALFLVIAVSGASSLGARVLATAPPCLAALSFAHRHGVGTLGLRVEGRPWQDGNETEQNNWRKIGSAKDVLVDAGLALGLWTIWTIVEMAWPQASPYA